MRALLDTNIVIHRENSKITNYSIGHLFRWLDKLKFVKVIHPYTVRELNKHNNEELKEVIKVKLQSYEILKTIKIPDDQFLHIIREYKKDENDDVDNCLLYEVYLNRVDILITEDRKMRDKSVKLGISDRVFSINQFISYVTSKHPDLIDYKVLAVRKEIFGNIDIKSPFFDSFRRDYQEFDKWFNKKCDETAYICKNERGLLLGFLYLKVEDENENYNDIIPTFNKARRLKIGTFKVESTGFRLGERFIKIIFDNALQYNVDEIYVTIFKNKPDIIALSELLERWGFLTYGVKKTLNGEETVLVKKMKTYDNQLSVKSNFPNIRYNKQKFILPILDVYHTTLLPDSKLKTENEVDFLGLVPHRYALQKVYITWSSERNINPGDLIIFYRIGKEGTNKKYSSVITTLGIVEEIICDFNNKQDFLKQCQNRSVFSNNELDGFWTRNGYNLKVLKFIYVKSLTKRLTLGYLWDKGIINAPYGPRPFTRISDQAFDQILVDSQTEVKFIY